ncbi:acyl-CoA dehydrogenase family protein [Streptomyces roseolilacinus]|uniref:Medium-chain specific acyl-CoA dehydrogenase, mitochondrial n=1 Tax=Streptomyces roseolilacinus TaxID=66904 RepID=A0A918EJ02_9ACTN|nr:acyl-CoA dehydrogenase family protein [Streptomyces roseolilacinus]GGP93663.1 long-chain-acyl-CoA dehydrogenase [Streptomyces roseolilacinus]
MTAGEAAAPGTGADPVPGADAPYLTAAQDRLRERVRGVLARAVLPHADRWEELRHVPAEAWRTLGDAGLLGLPLTGPGFLDSAVLLEELGRTGYAGVRAAVGVHAYMAASYLELFGTPRQRAAYLPAVRRGERVAALAISEEGAGSDLRGLSTRAVADGPCGYRVTGRKCHVANGSRAGFYVTLARTRQDAPRRGLAGASLLVVDADLPGVTRRPRPLAGWHAADVCEVEFDDVPVPADRLIGKPDRALVYLMRALDLERLAAGLLAVGGAAYCVGLLDRFVRTHRVRDAPLGAQQAVRHRVADLTAELDLVRHYGLRAAWLHGGGRLDTATASVLKLRSTELAVAAAQACVRFHGARGLLEGSAVARLYRDAAAGTIAGGASELMRELIYESTGERGV